MSLTQDLKFQEKIDTDLGVFHFVKHIGEGGNSEVFLFEKEVNKEKYKVAIKFLKIDLANSQLARFKDEYFCIQQIDSHPNIAKYYHFDQVKVGEQEYYIIIMKFYESSLSKMKITSLEETEKAAELKNLFTDLFNGLKFLHANEIIHRDIKPQNILFDANEHKFVLADMGIAKFPESLMREAHTDKSDRLANFTFSPKEQLNSKIKPLPNYDIYSFGQVLNWYMLEKAVGGTNRTSFANPNSPKVIKVLDKVVDKCVNDNPAERFQTMEEIKDFLKSLNKPITENKIDYWEIIHNFDEIIRRNFTKINNIEETSDLLKISRFFNDFNNINPENFWTMDISGGDNPAKPIFRLQDNSDLWLFWGYAEIKISKLIIYRNGNNPHKNFFIILTEPSNHFEYTHHISGQKELSKETYERELTNFWMEKSIYIQHENVKNGYLELEDGHTIKVSDNDFPQRERIYKHYAYMIAPIGTPLNMADREFSEKLMEKALNNGVLNLEDIREYENSTRGKFADGIKMWL
ncbi:protein kinase domain-containing protein [Moraxella osloensis]|uniref:Protein kinase domain-containing protein n=1 Tax=Faucicola osloensis TaxID=34062 RepID=A0A2D2LY09_FAUOS|nr:protein kinase [Moraxella osloensis]ATR79876.1 hypothetical protein NP7_10995 [Moraxella osloensis]